MYGLSFLIAVVGHPIIVLWLIWRTERWDLPRWLVIFVVSVFFSAVLGAITMAISSDFARQFINPFGVRLADFLYDNWYPEAFRPDNWEDVLPWALKYPQAYILMTMALYCSIGAMLSFWSVLRTKVLRRTAGLDIYTQK
ncbi:MAG: hypothetical protein HN929_09610 [Chloroflexi bacterium]|jgi:hypothetical protein|nr:hypothetical protein [Chloroflexota bacterium]MBT7081705.1 hypothetical protein [Chloroflexota bacterium]MBT7289148.1 hypothetical protein [Chloroflexota bacterium]